jgi:acyl-coenzyme A thioesterase 13
MSYIAILRSKIGQPYADFCLSPAGAWLGGTLAEVRDDGLTMSIPVRPEMCNPFGALHGGMASAMMDELMGASVAVCGGYTTWFTSVNLSVDFLNSGKAGDTVLVAAHIIRKGKNIAHIEASILRESDKKILAKATTNMANTFREIG